MYPFPTIKTKRFVLRQFGDDDLQNVFLGLSNPKVTKYYGISFDSFEAAREQIVWYKNLEETKTGIWWAICNKDDETFIGGVGISSLDDTQKKAELGFWLLPEYWGKEIIKEVVPNVCNYCFNELALQILEARIEPDNTNCKKVLNKLDFKFEREVLDRDMQTNGYIILDLYVLQNPNMENNTMKID